MKKKNLVMISGAAIVCMIGFGMQVHAFEPNSTHVTEIQTDNMSPDVPSNLAKRPAVYTNVTKNTKSITDTVRITCAEGHPNCDGTHSDQNHNQQNHSGSFNQHHEIQDHSTYAGHHRDHHN